MRLQRSVKKYKRSRLSTLPISLLRRLFEHCDLLDRIALAQTCVTLRQAAQSIPALWCKFRIHEYPALHKASYLFHWSYPRLVDVALSLSMDGPLGAFGTFTEAMFPRLEAFQLTVFANTTDSDLIRVAHYLIGRAMSRPAPHMQSLSLKFFPDWETGTLALRSDLLDGDPGVLRTLALRGTRPPPLPEPCTALSMLRTLDLTIYPTEGHETFTAQELALILAHSPMIETFGIQATSYLEDTGSEVIFTAVCPQLKRLAIDFYNASRLDSARALACRFLGLEELAFSLSTDALAPLHDLSKWAGPLLKAYVPDHSDSILDFGTQEGTDLRVKVQTPLDDWEFLCSDRLVSLVIHEHVFAGQSPPPAPNLTDLCIVLATRATIRENTHICGVLEDSALVFDYPALRKLQFAHIPPVCSYTLEATSSTTPTHLGTYDSNYGWTIALTDMIDFIRHRLLLQPPGRQLDALVLTGMRDIVDVDLAQSLRTLNTLVAHIEFEQSLPPHVLQNLSPPHLGLWHLTSIFTPNRLHHPHDYHWPLYIRKSH